MGDFFKSTAGKIVIGAAVAVIVVGIAVAFLVRKDEYRNIAVEQFNGNVVVSGEKNNGQVYEGQHLFSGDEVSFVPEKIRNTD